MQYIRSQSPLVVPENFQKMYRSEAEIETSEFEIKEKFRANKIRVKACAEFFRLPVESTRAEQSAK